MTHVSCDLGGHRPHSLRSQVLKTTWWISEEGWDVFNSLDAGSWATGEAETVFSARVRTC